MPIYEYECDACGHRFERIQRFADPLVDVCPKCGEHRVQKLLSSPAIQFKGSGWYVTDYAGKGAAPKQGDGAKDGAAAESKDANASKDSKSAAGDSKGTPGTTDAVKPAS
jgi:putative FmdB family regulatory protein